MVGQNNLNRKSVCEIIPGHQVRVTQETVPIPARQRTPGDQPQVQLIEQGGILQAIEIICTCGEHIRLRCTY